MAMSFSVTDLVDQFFEVQSTWKRHTPDAAPKRRYKALVQAFGLPDDWPHRLDGSRDAAWDVIQAVGERTVGCDLTRFSDLSAEAQWATLDETERQAAEHTCFYMDERQWLWRARQDQAGMLCGPIYPLDQSLQAIVNDAKAGMLEACRRMDALVFERMFGIAADTTVSEEDVCALSGVTQNELEHYLFDTL